MARNVNTRAILDMTSQFDFYHGGGLDVCYLSFAEVDQHGNVGVHKFNGKIMGTGGFIDISATRRKNYFLRHVNCGQFKTEITDGTIKYRPEGTGEEIYSNYRKLLSAEKSLSSEGWMFVISLSAQYSR